MPAAQGTLSPPLPTAEVSEMGTDVAVVPCGADGCRRQVCSVYVSECAFVFICLSARWYVCMRVSAAGPGSDLCLSVFFCQLASASWWAVCVRHEARGVCVSVISYF